MSRLQPRAKALATSNLSSQELPSSHEPLPRTPSSFKPPPRQSTTSTTARASSVADSVSDRTTVNLVRRTLCSHLGDKGRNTSTPAPIEDLLPPLTSSNEVDLQLYAFIAIIVREFINTWYAKITPDQVFVEEVVKIIAHCTRALEQRLREVDLESLLFDELPDLLDVHVRAYRTAHSHLHPPPLETNARQIYHSLCPLPALSPVPDDANQYEAQQQAENEAAYRQLLVQGVLAVLLPTEDLENECLTALVGQIFSEMILGNGIGGKASEPWLLWEGITKIAELFQSKLPKSKAHVRIDGSISQPPSSRDVGGRSTKGWNIGRSIQNVFWLVLQYAFFAVTAIRFIIITVATSSSLPSRVASRTKMTGSVDSKRNLESPRSVSSQDREYPLKQPILRMSIWSCVSSLLDLEARMPWLNATISILQWGALTGPGQVGATDGMVDKILSHAIHTHVLSPAHLAPSLRGLRSALFPSNSPAPPRAPPSSRAEQLALRRRCAETILDLIPDVVQDVYFGRVVPVPRSIEQKEGEEEGDNREYNRRVQEFEDVLDVFGDAYCNKHLLYSVVELLLVRLIPELAEKGVEELMEERLS